MQGNRHSAGPDTNGSIHNAYYSSFPEAARQEVEYLEKRVCEKRWQITSNRIEMR